MSQHFNQLDIIQLPVLTDNYIYFLHDSVSGETAVVDPALAQPVLDLLAKKGWRLTYILNTHHHWDHVGGNLELKEKTDCNIIAAQSDIDRTPVLQYNELYKRIGQFLSLLLVNILLYKQNVMMIYVFL